MSATSESRVAGPEPRCSVCGSRDVFAKIEGKYYCFKCGSRLVIEHSKKIVEEYVKKYIGDLR